LLDSLERLFDLSAEALTRRRQPDAAAMTFKHGCSEPCFDSGNPAADGTMR